MTGPSMVCCIFDSQIWLFSPVVAKYIWDALSLPSTPLLSNYAAQSKNRPSPLVAPESSEAANPSRSVPSTFWSKYQSPLGWRIPSRSPNSPSSTQDAVAYAQGVLDLAPLRSRVIARYAPDRPLCRHEVPGGGLCVDMTCTFAHLRDLTPNDEDVALYLAGIFSSFSATQIFDVLRHEKAKLHGQALNLRIALVLEKLGLR